MQNNSSELGHYVFDFGNKTPLAPSPRHALRLTLRQKIRCAIVKRIWAIRLRWAEHVEWKATR